MNEDIIYDADGNETQPLKTYAERAYLDYSMYVILDRALPHVGDGLKPVQRRIIYAMSELGLKAGAKYKKSARTVGDVIGKFHPHGDSAAYEAMVLMAQPFSYRYPLVDGQGNWGSPDDPKSFAAMRYTESRLTAYSSLLLDELGQGTVDWQPNFDGALEEPKLLPAKLPNLLLNGGTGIAVGMATDIPPHNMREVASACIRVLEDPKVTEKQLLEHIKGPDFPTEAPIIAEEGALEEIYLSGRGSVRQRAAWMTEGSDIVVTALPHHVSGARVLEQIAEQMNTKKLPMVTDLRDESDHENPTRLIITPKSNRVDNQGLMAHLFATTDLERNHRVNLNVIGIDGRPGVKSLLKLLKEWVQFRLETVRRRLQYRLDHIEDRLHLLEGLLIAFLNLDEVIHLIRTEDEPRPVLMERFGLTQTQADYVLDTRLRQLARLEEVKIRAEQSELLDEKADIEKTLGSPARMKKLVITEISEMAEAHGDDRRSPIVSESIRSQAFSEEDLITTEPVTAVLSEKGWIRVAKGHDIDPEALNYRSGDGYLAHAPGKSNQQVAFLDSSGRSYSLPAHTLPSARGQGEPLTGRLSPASGVAFRSMVFGSAKDTVLLASDAGYGFLCSVEDLHANKKAGKAMLTLPSGAKVLPAIPVKNPEEDMLAAVSNEGRLLVFPVSELPRLARGKGNKIIGIPSARVKSREEFVVAITVLPLEAELLVHSGKRFMALKGTDLAHFSGERGRRGGKLPRGFQRVDALTVADEQA